MRPPILLVAGFLLMATPPVLAGESFTDNFDLPANLTYVGAESCLDCHDDVGAFYAHSPHAPVLGLVVPGTGTYGCEACHGPGSKHVEGGGEGFIIGAEALGAMNENQQVEMCLQCHTGQAHNWDTSAHAGSGISCNDCHADQVHYGGQAVPAGDFRNQSEFCLQCHPELVADFRMPFRHRVLEGEIACNDCHDPHAGFEAADWNGLNETCTGCHTEMRGPFVFEHEGFTAEDCTACHRSHGSMNDKLLTQDSNTLCLQCHYDSDFNEDGGFTIGSQGHAGLLGSEARCYDCHHEIHGSNVSATLGN